MAEQTFLSARGEKIRDHPCLMLKYGTKVIEAQNIINIGLAENTLCEDLLTEKIRSLKMDWYKPEYQYYTQFSGMPSFRKVLAQFLEKRFNACMAINPDNLLVTTGVGVAVELLALMLCDPGDCFLIHSPYYEMISFDMGVKANIKPVLDHVKVRNGNGELIFRPDISQTEKTILAAQKKGHRIRMALILNPNNPTGNILTREEIMELLTLFNKYKIHVVMDEIYGLTMLGDNSFSSILSMDNLPCPEMVHFVWGFSKDFGLSGFRCAVIHTLSPNLTIGCKAPLYLSCVSSVVQSMCTHLISDEDWLDRTYFPENKKRMDIAYEYMRRRLDEYGFKVYSTRAGFFVWANLGKLMPLQTFEEEMKLHEDIVSAGVYIIPGHAMKCEEPGWFRFTFSRSKEDVDEAFVRLDSVIAKRARDSNNSVIEETFIRTCIL